jgi:hypothetical protein
MRLSKNTFECSSFQSFSRSLNLKQIAKKFSLKKCDSAEVRQFFRIAKPVVNVTERFSFSLKVDQMLATTIYLGT